MAHWSVRIAMPACVHFDLLEFLGGDEGHQFEGRPFTGFAVEFFANGNLWAQVEFRNGVENGSSREWTENGMLREQRELFRGVLHGHSLEWDPSGRLLREAWHAHGILLIATEREGDVIACVKETPPAHRDLLERLRRAYPNAPLVTPTT